MASKKKQQKSLVAVSEEDATGTIYLGCLMMPTSEDDESPEDRLQDLWDRWRDEVINPDADSDFIDWLIENGHGTYPVAEVILATVR